MHLLITQKEGVTINAVPFVLELYLKLGRGPFLGKSEIQYN